MTEPIARRKHNCPDCPHTVSAEARHLWPTSESPVRSVRSGPPNRLLLAFDGNYTAQEVVTCLDSLRARFPDVEFTAVAGVRQIFDLGPAREDPDHDRRG